MKKRNIGKSAMHTAMAMLLVGIATACDSVIYDEEEDCVYRIRFRYDYNLKWADAFGAEVERVTLYIINPNTGEIVKELTESGSSLHEPGYEIVVDDLEPGRYDLLAWCGDDEHGSFEIPARGRVTTLTPRLRREIDSEGKHYHSRPMDRLYYGSLTNCEFTEDYQDVFTVPLIKDTNDIRIVLQHLSGEAIPEEMFEYTITSSNGSLDHQNRVVPDERITYKAWNRFSGTAALETAETVDSGTTRAQSSYSAVAAEFTVPRLIQEHTAHYASSRGEGDRDVARLNIRKADTGETVVDIPLIDALLLVKGYYRHPATEGTQSRPLTDQEYLDRQDDYSLTFFLDEGFRWMDSYIYINSWKIVIQNEDL